MLEKLEKVGISREHLEAQWMEQVQEQTKPAKCQSALLIDRKIFDILVLMKSLKSYEEEKHLYQKMLENGVYSDGLVMVDLSSLLENAQKNIKLTKKAIANKRGKLSVYGCLNLTKLVGNEFLKRRMNALALKQRL